MFRHALVDASGVVIAEAVRPDKEEATIAAFWADAFEGRPLTAIVTDMDKKYEPALDAVVRARFPLRQIGGPRPVLHQYCPFHAYRYFSRECREAEVSAKRKEGGRKASYDVERPSSASPSASTGRRPWRRCGSACPRTTARGSTASSRGSPPRAL